MQIVSSVTFEELLTAINIEDGEAGERMELAFSTWLCSREKKYILQTKWDVSFVGAETVK